MGKTYAVQVTSTDQFGEPDLVDRTVIYADTELEARMRGAVLLGVEDWRVEVLDLNSPVPTDAEMNAIQQEARDATADVPDYMRGAGTVYE